MRRGFRTYFFLEYIYEIIYIHFAVPKGRYPWYCVIRNGCVRENYMNCGVPPQNETVKIMLNELIKQVGEDCIRYGHGRKKWWADQLQIPPLTLSHWFAGRQMPSGEYALAINEIIISHAQEERAKKRINHLWEAYYKKENIPLFLLSEIILGILSKETIDSRTLALLSVFVENREPLFDVPIFGRLKNRLGWLLQVSGQKPVFNPDRLLPCQSLLQAAPYSAGLNKYLKRFQTKWGKKWRLYDCSLKEMKASLPWT